MEIDARQLAAELVEQARAEGVGLVGPGGVIDRADLDGAGNHPGGEDVRACGVRDAVAV
jgi:hypothetical protein